MKNKNNATDSATDNIFLEQMIALITLIEKIFEPEYNKIISDQLKEIAEQYLQGKIGIVAARTAIKKILTTKPFQISAPAAPAVPSAPSASTESLKPGDAVQLRSGGPLMTVDSVDGDKAYCIWIADGKFGGAVINFRCLI